MKKLVGLLFCFSLISCYFGANESSSEIINNFYLTSWDETTWIAYSVDGDSIYEPKNIIIDHGVFAVGNDDNFIIVKQHPCENKEEHFIDYDSLKPNKAITNYYIIDTRNNLNKLHYYNNSKDFNDNKIRFGVSKNLLYQFYNKEF